MNFSCENCQRRYTIADDKVRERAVRIRCKACQHLMSVGPLPAPEPAFAPEAAEEDRTRMVSVDALEKLRAQTKAPAQPTSQTPWDDEPTRAASASEAGALWFVSVQGKQIGPFATAALVDKVHGGEIQPRNFMWKKGMADWKRGVDIPELTVLFEADVSDPSHRPPPAASTAFDLPDPGASFELSGGDPAADAQTAGYGSDFGSGFNADDADAGLGASAAARPSQELDAGSLFSDLELSKVVRAPDLSDINEPGGEAAVQAALGDSHAEPSEPSAPRPARAEPVSEPRPTRPMYTPRGTVAMSANSSGGGVFRKLLATLLFFIALAAGAGFVIHERLVEVPAEVQAQVDEYWPVKERALSPPPAAPVAARKPPPADPATAAPAPAAAAEPSEALEPADAGVPEAAPQR